MSDYRGYSRKEVAMFARIGVELEVMRMVTVNQLYNAAVRKAFIENQQGPAVESLRRCIMEWDKGEKDGVRRLTPEWDALIEL